MDEDEDDGVELTIVEDVSRLDPGDRQQFLTP
jgi:hypothetical protein